MPGETSTREVEEVSQLPEDQVLEELRIFYKTTQDQKRQRVFLYAKRNGNQVFQTTKEGTIISSETPPNIYRLSYIIRSPR